MFFSRIRLTQTQQAMSELKNLYSGGSYQSHQMLWKLFDDEKRHFLFRQEKDINSSMPIFYLLSQQEPIDKRGVFQVETKAFAPKLVAGDKLGFKLRVNPIICINNQRHDVLMHAKKRAKASGISDPVEISDLANSAAINWITNEKRCEDIGIQFEFPPDLISQEQHATFKKNQTIKYTAVDYSGQLTVIEPNKFLSKVSSGIGKSKAFGCGLFLIRKL